MKKVVFKLDLHDEKSKSKAMKAVSSISGVDSISMDMKDKKLTVTGDFDPVNIVSKLRKLCYTEIISVGPAKVPTEKTKKTEEKKKDSKDEVPGYVKAYHAFNPHMRMKKTVKKDEVAELVKAYQAYNPDLTHYYVRSAEEDPNACVIC